MALVVNDLADQIYKQLVAQLLKANPAPQTPEDGMKDMAAALATAIVPYLTANLTVMTPDNLKCTVS